MKPFLEKISVNNESSYVCKHFARPAFGFAWHFHQEYELTVILKSSGKRFVGDNISKYEKGDLVLLGPNLPHTWYTDPAEHSDKSDSSESIVVQFLDNFLGEQIWVKPEFKKIKNLLLKSHRGLFFPQHVFEKYKNSLLQLPEKKSLDRLVLLLEILNGLAEENDTQILTSMSYSPQINETHQNRIEEVFKFTHENFLSEKINQKLLAKRIFMSESAFSHFFKKATGKTFTYYLNELRIGIACKKLVESDATIVNICYQSGFQNLSNFNKRFLMHKGCTPKQFRQNFIKPIFPG